MKALQSELPELAQPHDKFKKYQPKLQKEASKMTEAPISRCRKKKTYLFYLSAWRMMARLESYIV